MTKKPPNKALHLQKQQVPSTKVWGDRTNGLRAWSLPESTSTSTKWLYDHLNNFYSSKKRVNVPNLVKHFSSSDGLEFLAASTQVSLPFDHAAFLLEMAKVDLDMEDYFGAKILLLTAYLLYQTKVSDAKEVVDTVKGMKAGDSLEQLSYCYRGDNATTSPDQMKLHLDELNIDELKAEVARDEPKITINVIENGQADTKVLNSLINLNTALTLTLDKVEKNIRIKHNDERLFLSSAGKKTLSQLGIVEGDTLEIEDPSLVLQPTVIVSDENVEKKSNSRTKKTKKKKTTKKKKKSH